MVKIFVIGFFCVILNPNEIAENTKSQLKSPNTNYI